MRIQEIMSEPVHTVVPGLDAQDAWEVMQTNGIRHLVVAEASKVVGVLSDGDAGGRHGGAIREGATVADLMDRHVPTVRRTDTIRKAANLMNGHLVGCLPVVERGRLVGVVTISDMLTVVGGGAGRPSHNARAALHHRVPHRKVRTATGRW